MHRAVSRISSCSPGSGGGCQGFPKGCAKEVRSGQEELLDWFRLASGMLPCHNKPQDSYKSTRFVLQNNRTNNHFFTAFGFVQEPNLSDFYLFIGQKLHLWLTLLEQYSHAWNVVALSLENPSEVTWHFQQPLTLFIFFLPLSPSPSSTGNDKTVPCGTKL